MATRRLQVVIVGDNSSLERSLADSGTAVGRFENRLQSSGSRMQQFGRSAMRVGRNLTLGLTLPLIGWGALAFQELNDGAEAMAQTEAVIRSTGGAADRSAPQIARMASALSEMSGIDDEDIQASMNVLLTSTNLAGRNFDDAAESALDLSVAMHTDLLSSSKQVGRALNDPIRGLTALRRANVDFSAEQENTIRSMVAFGNTAGAQRIILEELNEEVGGSAAAFGRTPAARLRRLKQRFEELGASILEDAMPALEDFAGIIEGLADKYDRLTPTQQKFVAGAVGLGLVAGPLSTVLGAVASALGAIGAALGISTGIVLLAVVAIGVLAFAIYELVTNWDKVRDVAASAYNTIAANGVAHAAILTVKGALDVLYYAFWPVIQGAKFAYEAIKTIGVVTFAIVRAGIQGLSGDLNSAYSNAQSLLQTLISIDEMDKQGSGPIPKAGTSSGAAVVPRSVAGAKSGPRSGRGRRLASRESNRPAPVFVVAGLS